MRAAHIIDHVAPAPRTPLAVFRSRVPLADGASGDQQNFGEIIAPLVGVAGGSVEFSRRSSTRRRRGQSVSGRTTNLEGRRLSNLIRVRVRVRAPVRVRPTQT